MSIDDNTLNGSFLGLCLITMLLKESESWKY